MSAHRASPSGSVDDSQQHRAAGGATTIPRAAGIFRARGPDGDNSPMREPAWRRAARCARSRVLGARGPAARASTSPSSAPRLRRVIDNDATCWHTLDPQTRLMTSDAPRRADRARRLHRRDGAAAAGELMVRSEYLSRGLQHVRRARRAGGCRSAILEQATRGRPGAQRALPRAARAVRASRTSCARPSSSAAASWGAVHVARREASGAFTERDAEALASVAPRSPTASAARCASTPPAAAPAPKRRAWSCSTPTTRSS